MSFEQRITVLMRFAESRTMGKKFEKIGTTQVRSGMPYNFNSIFSGRPVHIFADTTYLNYVWRTHQTRHPVSGMPLPVPSSA